MARKNRIGGTIVTKTMRIVIGENASHDSVDRKFYTTSLNGLLKTG